MFWGYLFALAFVRDDPMWLVVKLLKAGGLQVIVLDQCWECFPIHQHPRNKWNGIRSRMVDYYNKFSKKYLSELWMLDSIWFNQAVGYLLRHFDNLERCCRRSRPSKSLQVFWAFWCVGACRKNGAVSRRLALGRILINLSLICQVEYLSLCCWRLYTIIMIIIRTSC